MSDRPRQDVKLSRGNGSVGRVFALQAKGRRFDSGFLQPLCLRRIVILHSLVTRKTKV